MNSVTIAPFELLPLLPLIVVGLGALALLLVDAFIPAARRALPWLSLLLVLSAFALAWFGPTGAAEPFPGMLAADALARFFDLIVLGAVATAILLGVGYHEELEQGEYYALLLFAAFGMMVLAHATNFLTVFLGVETLSIALYALTGFLHKRATAVEAALKYFFLGAFSAAFLVYGMALVYGATGTLEIAAVADALGGPTPPILALAGLGLMLVGFGFKISAVPFHMWTPDVYDGAPTPVAGFMSVATKAVAFAALLRVLVTGLGPLAEHWVPVVAGLAFVSMLGGNVVAVVQRASLKRMLAFSSIAHAGYVLVGLVAWDTGGKEAMLFYLLAYAFMNLGAFGVLAVLERNGESVLLYDLSGLSERRPWLAAAMALFMLSLAGVPPTAGFVGKFYIFMSAVDAGWIKLAVFGVLYAAIAAYYYLRVIVVMYMREPADEELLATPRLPGRLAITLLAVGVLLLGILPSSALSAVMQSAASLLR